MRTPGVTKSSPTWSRRSLKRAGAVALVTIAGACGGGTTSKSAAAAPHPSPAATPVTAADTSDSIDSAGDSQMAAGISLQLHDFPSMWSGSPHVVDQTQEQHDRALAACLGVPFYRAFRTANVDSQDFASGDATVSDNVGVYTKSSVVTTDMAAFGGPKAKGCFDATIRGSLTPGEVITSLDIKVTPGAAPGRTTQKAAVAAHLVGTSGGLPFDSDLEVLYMGKNRVEAEVDISSIHGPVPSSDIELAGDRVSSRLAASA